MGLRHPVRLVISRPGTNALQHTDCNTLQHTATHCNTLQHTAAHCSTLQHTATHCSTLQHTATHCNTLQHTATHCNTLHHIATHCTPRSTAVRSARARYEVTTISRLPKNIGLFCKRALQRRLYSAKETYIFF